MLRQLSLVWHIYCKCNHEEPGNDLNCIYYQKRCITLCMRLRFWEMKTTRRGYTEVGTQSESSKPNSSSALPTVPCPFKYYGGWHFTMQTKYKARLASCFKLMKTLGSFCAQVTLLQNRPPLRWKAHTLLGGIRHYSTIEVSFSSFYLCCMLILNE